MVVGSLLLAFGAAGCNAASSVLQRKANREQPTGSAFGPRLLLALVRNPQWLFGGVAMIASFLLQAVALDTGTLSAVEPVLVLELPLTFILASVTFRRRLPGRDWLASVAMAGGLAMFIAALAPSGGHADTVSALLTTCATAITALAVAGCAVLARLAGGRTKAALFGVAAGTGFGLTASLIKIAMTRLSDGGLIGLFTAWETYGFAATGVASVIMTQAALHAGSLVAAQPGITLLDPLVALLWGTAVLGEVVRTGPILVLAAVGASCIVLGVLVLARSPHAGYAGAFDTDDPDGGI